MYRALCEVLITLRFLTLCASVGNKKGSGEYLLTSSEKLCSWDRVSSYLRMYLHNKAAFVNEITSNEKETPTVL